MSKNYFKPTITCLTFLVIFNHLICSSQNLVLNPSFELYSQCPDDGNQMSRAIDVKNGGGTADYMNSCNTTMRTYTQYTNFGPCAYSVPLNCFGWQKARTGNAYANIATRCPVPPYPFLIHEYILLKLSTPLTIGQVYNVRFFVSLADFVSSGQSGLGAAFSTTESFTSNQALSSLIPQYVDQRIITDTSSWTEIRFSFTADKAYKYLTIGQFKPQSASAQVSINSVPQILQYYLGCSFYYIDDVGVFPKCNPEKTKTLNYKICKGETLQILDTTVRTSGSFLRRYFTESGCDSTVTHIISLNDTFNIQKSKFICKGDSVTEGSSVYKTAGTFVNRYRTRFGCDSTIRTIVQVTDTSFYRQSQTICFGQSFQVADSTYSTSGTYRNYTKTRQGCDSIITTTITIAYPDTSYLDSTKCRGQTVKIGNKTFGNSGQFKEVLRNRSGCDSVIYLNLRIVETDSGSRSFTVCEGETVADAGRKFTSEGRFQTTLLDKSSGCDSIHTTIINHIKLRLELQQEPNSKIDYGQTSTLTASFSGPNQVYSWEPNELVECSTCPQTRTRNLTRNTTFSGIILDTLFNCRIKKDIQVQVNCPIEVPNLVTTNNDNLNDYLYLKNKDCIGNVLSLRVFNRWGKEIYSKNNYPAIPEIELWTPTHAGTYYYLLEVKEFEGDKRSFKGWIQVVK